MNQEEYTINTLFNEILIAEKMFLVKKDMSINTEAFCMLSYIVSISVIVDWIFFPTILLFNSCSKGFISSYICLHTVWIPFSSPYYGIQ